MQQTVIKRLVGSLILALTLFGGVRAQLITSEPLFFGPRTKGLRIIFDASQGNGGLRGYTGELYAHTGVITAQSSSDSDWRHAPAWGDNAPKYRLEALGNDRWSLRIDPDIEGYYGLSAGERVRRLAFVFRSADKSREGKTAEGGDIFLDLAPESLALRLVTTPDLPMLPAGEAFDIRLDASQPATLSLYANGVLLAQESAATQLHYRYTPSEAGALAFVAHARSSDGNEVKERLERYLPHPTQEAPRPEWLREGITRRSDTEAGLLLYAPRKQNIFVLGSFNAWRFDPRYQMKRDGDYWWLTLEGLHPDSLYSFQYAVDNASLRLSDPYTELVLDPWNDSHIAPGVFPKNLSYPVGKAQGLVATLTTRPSAYQWEVKDFVLPDAENLVIYEMLLRDFTDEGSLRAAIERLDYLQTLGVTAIELMPIQEFDGNRSWGYNPNHFFAPDKAYGSPDMYRRFVDECHKRGIAVILDMVFNHATGAHPFARLYWDAAASRTAPDNPWFNPIAPHPYSVFHDFNHEFEGTRRYFREVLRYWLREYRVDGFRMDLTKGFTQRRSTEATASAYDASRVAILSDYYDAARQAKSDVIFILEHFCEKREEQELAEKGMYLWRNVNHAFSQAAMGYPGGSSFGPLLSTPRRWVGYAESHDEERNFYKAATWGADTLKTNAALRLRRVPLNMAFNVLTPGPKMIWQFGEMGYDYSIEHNGRTGDKPAVWHWLDDSKREMAYVHTARCINLRKQFPAVFREGKLRVAFSDNDWETGRSLHIEHPDLNIVVLGNFKPAQGIEAQVSFPHSGVWHEIINDAPLQVTSRDTLLNLAPGQLYVFVDRRINFPEGLQRYRHPGEFTDRRPLIPQVVNPVRGEIVLQTSSAVEQILLYDLRGNLLLHDRSGKKKLDASFLEKGIYVLRVHTPSGQYTFKLIRN